MSATGKRLVFVGTERVEVESFEVPEPGPGQVLVRVHLSQVSAGSEKNKFLDPSGPGARRPVGYTTVGRVLAVGPGMDGYRTGDRVMSFGNHASHWMTGRPPDSAPAMRGQRLPESIDFDVSDEQAAFAVLGAVALHSVRRGQVQIDESVAVFGQGVVGQMVTALCRIAGGYPVVAIDLDDDRLRLAKESGATHTVNASREDAAEAVRALTGGGAQCVFHAARVPDVLVDCMKAAAPRGKVIVPGYPPGAVEIGLQAQLLQRELDIRGVWASDQEYAPHPYWPWTRQRNRRAIWRMIFSGDLRVDHLVSHVSKPEEANDMFKKIVAGPRGWMSVFFDWRDEPSS